MGPAVFMISASYSGCNRTLVVALFTLSLAVMSFHYTGMKLNALDLSPNYSGTLMGLVNGLGVFAGMLAPYIIGILTPEQTLQEWRIIFLAHVRHIHGDDVRVPYFRKWRSAIVERSQTGAHQLNCLVARL
jgi:fucose permease